MKIPMWNNTTVPQIEKMSFQWGLVMILSLLCNHAKEILSFLVFLHHSSKTWSNLLLCFVWIWYIKLVWEILNQNILLIHTFLCLISSFFFSKKVEGMPPIFSCALKSRLHNSFINSRAFFDCRKPVIFICMNLGSGL